MREEKITESSCLGTGEPLAERERVAIWAEGYLSLRQQRKKLTPSWGTSFGSHGESSLTAVAAGQTHEQGLNLKRVLGLRDDGLWATNRSPSTPQRIQLKNINKLTIFAEAVRFEPHNEDNGENARQTRTTPYTSQIYPSV